MSHQDYTTRLRLLAEEMRQEGDRMEEVVRTLSDAEVGRMEALWRAHDFLLRALEELESVPRVERNGMTRGDEGPTSTASGGESSSAAKRGPVESSGLAGDDDTPGYGRGGGVRG